MAMTKDEMSLLVSVLTDREKKERDRSPTAKPHPPSLIRHTLHPVLETLHPEP
jgi:hypothetical protein